MKVNKIISVLFVLCTLNLIAANLLWTFMPGWGYLSLAHAKQWYFLGWEFFAIGALLPARLYFKPSMTMFLFADLMLNLAITTPGVELLGDAIKWNIPQCVIAILSVLATAIRWFVIVVRRRNKK